MVHSFMFKQGSQMNRGIGLGEYLNLYIDPSEVCYVYLSRDNKTVIGLADDVQYFVTTPFEEVVREFTRSGVKFAQFRPDVLDPEPQALAIALNKSMVAEIKEVADSIQIRVKRTRDHWFTFRQVSMSDILGKFNAP